MPAQLVKLAAVWGQRWHLGRHGHGCGPAGVLGKGLAGAPVLRLELTLVFLEEERVMQQSVA